jgi:hypothetical protein
MKGKKKEKKTYGKEEQKNSKIRREMKVKERWRTKNEPWSTENKDQITYEQLNVILTD